jgi:hypothetical protein
MRICIPLILLLLCLIGKLHAQSPLLEKKVSLQYKQVQIGTILKDLNKRYKLKFSYSNNIVPEQKTVSLNIKNVMLKDALNDLFYETGVGFQVVGEQIVLKKSTRKNPSATKEYSVENPKVTIPVLYDPTINTEELIANSNKDFIIDTIQEEYVLKAPLLIKENDTPSKKDLRRKYKGQKKMLKARMYILKDSLRRKGSHSLDKLDMKYSYAAQKMKQQFDNILNSLGNNNGTIKDSTDKKETNDSTVTEKKDDYLYRPCQFTFISPLGTNGHDCGKTVNIFSLNMLGGYSAGLIGVEFGGIANVEKDFVKGLQLAGIANVVKNKTEGVQLSGFTNICGDSVKAVQAAGFLNVVNGSFLGMQAAGFCNVNKGSMEGFQGAGFINIIQDSLNGMQVAGFANVNNGNSNGIQAAGFINIAKKVKGMQIGILNIADSVEGLPIGFMSIVKKGGYRQFDAFTSEALYANLAYKIGVKSFYNIFQTGTQLKGNKIRWAVGYGIGSQIDLSKKVMVNFEDVTLSVWEPGMTTPQLNLLHKFSPSFGVRVGNKTTLYAGPTFNAMLSRYKKSGATELDSDLAPYSMYNHTFNPTAYNTSNLKLWIGFNVGIRF